MAILVVGGTSYIGSALIKYSNLKNITVVTARRCANLNPLCEHENESYLCLTPEGIPYSNPKNQFDTVFLFSTVYSRKEEDLPLIIKCNIDYLTNVTIHLKKYTKKFIYANTYMALPGVISEQSSFYAMSKALFSNFCARYLTGNIFENIYLFDIYGAGDKRRKFLDLVIEAEVKNEPLMASSGLQILSPISVDDVASILFERIEFSNEEQFTNYLLHGATWNTLKQIIETAEKICGKTFPIIWGSTIDNRDSIYEPIHTYQNLSDGREIANIHEIIEQTMSDKLNSKQPSNPCP